MAEFDEVATRERAPGLLQAATRRETAEVDRRESETLAGRRVLFVSGDHPEPTAFIKQLIVLDRPFIEAGGDDRVERLDDAGTWRQGRCGIGSCGVPRPSLAPYVTGTGATKGVPAAGGRSCCLSSPTREATGTGGLLMLLILSPSGPSPRRASFLGELATPPS
jgi:hypothetical protein